MTDNDKKEIIAGRIISYIRTDIKKEFPEVTESEIMQILTVILKMAIGKMDPKNNKKY